MSGASQKPAVEINAPIQFLKGCGPRRAQQLARLGIATVRDLLFFFPRDYQDLTDLRSVDEFEEGRLMSVLATVDEVELRDRPGGRSVLGVLLRQDSRHLRAIWFNQPFLLEKFRVGQRLLLSGKAKNNSGRWEMIHPNVQVVDGEEPPPTGQLLPVYPLTEGVQQRHVRNLMAVALEACTDLLEEVFPREYLDRHDLWPLRTALPQIHFPSDWPSLERARRRFVYQELLVLQLALSLRRQHVRERSDALPMETSAKIDARIRRLFPFAFTAAQDEAIAEVCRDMGQAYPMNRLLHGDVGSGKTVVAVYAMLLAVANGAQAVLMAPTEILARQHARTLERLLAASKVKWTLLTGGLGERERREALGGIASGETQIVIGTQAILEADVQFAKLGLVVIDEQHKFGVRQRATLRGSQLSPHYLVMSATPIPRTVGMTLFGDLDLSTLADGPAGRQNVHTYLAKPEDRPRWWEFFRRKLREGRQGYVITPLVEGNQQTQAASLEHSYESLANGELEEFRLGLVHGRLSAEAKDQAMQAFHRGDTQVLVATSVVEVGVDVPNATLMSIEAAERFGLAQLHQLRGRIGRGIHPGYCCLFGDPQTPDAIDRLQALLDSTDGFQLAELDFALRGPGDLIGTRQHGLPPMRIADLQRDSELLSEARQDAQALVAADPGLRLPEHALLRRMALVRYGEALDLVDVG